MFSFLCSMLHLQMGDESEPVTTWSARARHLQTISGFIVDNFNHCFFLLTSVRHFHSSCIIFYDVYSQHAVKSLSPSLIYGLYNVFHLSISRPFPCGRTLLSHLSPHISPHRPQITAPLRLVQAGPVKASNQPTTPTLFLSLFVSLCPLISCP